MIAGRVPEARPVICSLAKVESCLTGPWPPTAWSANLDNRLRLWSRINNN